MRDRFRHHHLPTEKERGELFSSCTFAVDTNVLLNIYRYADATRELLFTVFEGLQGRIWVPHHAALEFYKNRLGVIKEQREKFSELEKAIGSLLNTLRSGSFSKSSFLRIEEIESILKPAIEQAKKTVAAQGEKHPNLIRRDDYLERLALIVGNAVGEEPDRAAFEQRCTTAQARIDEKRPPGFCDANKPIPDRFGDVLIWFEILDHARAKQRPVVFVTDDDKEDWWQIVDGEKLGARPELRAEMQKHANVDFYTCRPAYFLEVAGKQLQVAVAPGTLDDASNVTAELQHEKKLLLPTVVGDFSGASSNVWAAVYADRQEYCRIANVAINQWLVRKYGTANVRARGFVEDDGWDFYVRIELDGNDEEFVIIKGVFVKVMFESKKDALFRAWNSALAEMRKGWISKKVNDCELVLVAVNEQTSHDAASLMREGPWPESRHAVTLGTVTDTGEFVEIASAFHR